MWFSPMLGFYLSRYCDGLPPTLLADLLSGEIKSTPVSMSIGVTY